MDVAGANTIVSTMITDIGSVLAAGLPLLLGLIAVLVGLFFVVRLIMRKIGRAR